MSKVTKKNKHKLDLSSELQSTRHKCRLLLLLDALERVGIAPVPMKKLHAFAYLADVLSPVWGFLPYDGKIYKMESGPHYSDLQKELDSLVMLRLVTILDLKYIDAGKGGAWIDGFYQLNLSSENLMPILDKLGGGEVNDALDHRDVLNHKYLVELASALATLPQDEIDLAAQVDATYSSPSHSNHKVIDFAATTEATRENLSVVVTEKFQNFMPTATHLTPGERVYLYANYLGQKLSA